MALGTAVVAATVALVLYTQTSFGSPAGSDRDDAASLRLAVGPRDLFAVVVGAF